MRFFPLEKLINLYDGYSRQFKNSFHLGFHRRELLFTNGQVTDHADQSGAHCPHRGHPLDSARISEGIVQCALHEYCFSLHDGNLLRYREEPCRNLRTWPLAYQGTEIGVILDDAPGE